MATKILDCTCEHKHQDKLYGKGKRVHNWASKVKGVGGWRCTVCKDVKPA